MTEPARAEPTKARHLGLGDPHPLLRMRPPAPRLKGRCTPQHFRSNVGVRLMPMCVFLNEVCWLSAKDGYCYAFQRTLANRLGLHVNTIARMSHTAEKAGHVTIVRTGRENLIFPNWKQLQLLGDEVVDQNHQAGGSPPLGGLKPNGAAARTRTRACKASPFAARSPKQSLNNTSDALAMDDNQRASKPPVTCPSEAQEGTGSTLTSSDTPVPAFEVTASLDGIQWPSEERMRELDGPKLVNARSIVSLTPAERALVLERQGPEALSELELMLESGRALGLNPYDRKRLVERAARVRTKLNNPGGYYCDLLKRAELGGLSGVTRRENVLGAQLWERENEAVGKGDFTLASKLRQVSYEVGKELRAEIRRLRDEQAALELEALFDGKPLPADVMSSAVGLPSPKPKLLSAGKVLVAEVVTTTAGLPSSKPKQLSANTALMAEVVTPATARPKHDVLSEREQLEKERNALEAKVLLPTTSRFLRPQYERRIQEIEIELAELHSDRRLLFRTSEPSA